MTVYADIEAHTLELAREVVTRIRNAKRNADIKKYDIARATLTGDIQVIEAVEFHRPLVMAECHLVSLLYFEGKGRLSVGNFKITVHVEKVLDSKDATS